MKGDRLFKFLFLLGFAHACHVQTYGQLQVQFKECLTCDTASIGDQSNNSTYYYGNATEYPTSLIASDYGPRRLGTDPYDWHGGVDYNSQSTGQDGSGDRGDLIIAIEGGTVDWSVSCCYKWIGVNSSGNDFGYGHVFRSTNTGTQRSGGCILKKMLPPNQTSWAIIRPDGTAIGEIAGSVLDGTDTLTVSTTVSAGEAIGPTGSSIAKKGHPCDDCTKPIAVHLHLYSFPNGNFNTSDEVTKDPLQFVEHDKPEYIIQILKENDTTPGIDLVYPGNNTGTVQVRPKLPDAGNNSSTYNTVYNVDSVKILIKKDYESDAKYMSILGPSKKSLFSHGAMIGTVRYNLATNSAGNWSTTGMVPRAYSLNPWDVFYFADFATRIHKDDELGSVGTSPHKYADCPDHARYNDGKYKVKAQIVNVVEEVQEGPKNASGTLTPVEITLDNFKPFVNKVRVKIGTDTIYQRQWNSKDNSLTQVDNGCMEMSGLSEKPTSDLNGNLGVEAYGSEPLQFLKAVIPTISVDTIAGVAADNSNMVWNFDFGSNLGLQDSSCHNVVFVGKDCNNNSLLDMKAMAGSNLNTACVEIPKRQNSGNQSNTWSPTANNTGKDDVHEFCIKSCTNFTGGGNVEEKSTGDCLNYTDIFIEVTNATAGENNGSIDLTVFDGSPPYAYKWMDVDGNIIATNEDLNDIFTGTYCYEVKDQECCSVTDCIVVENCALIDSINAVCICPGGHGVLNVEVSGGSGEYAYAWSGIGLSNPTIPNPIVNTTGTFTVTVTDVQTGCETTGEATVSNCSINLADYVEVNPDCNEEGTSTISVQLPTGYGLAPFEFKWVKLGFGLIETDGSTDGFASLENAEPGEYCLTLLAMNGCSENICEITVTELFAPHIDFSVMPVANGNDGEINLTVTGSSGPFSYLWSNGMTSSSIVDLSVGTYCVTVTDNGSGCTSTTCIQLVSCTALAQAIDPLEAEVTAITNNSNGTQTGGAIDITNVLDQFPGYDFTFHWFGPNGFSESSEDIIGLLSSGTYNVIVESANCQIFQLGLWELCSFQMFFNQLNTNCSTTSIKVGPNPTGTYKYLWDTGDTTQIINNVLLGVEHCVTLTAMAYVNDVWVEGCSASACYIPTSKPLGVELLNMVPATNGYADGSLEVNATGGLPSYQYNWSNGMTGYVINGLSPGYYTVTVEDACGNTAFDTYYIQCEFGRNDIDATVNDISCSTNTKGAIFLTQLPSVVSPNPTFVFDWSNGATTQNISDLLEGEYCVTITELTTGCYGIKCFSVGVTGTSSFNVAFEQNPGCYPLSEGSITAVTIPVDSSNQPQGPFNYSWGTWYWGTQTTFPNSPTLYDIPAGWYGVVVTDALGCTASNQTLMWSAWPTFTVTPLNSNGSPLTGPILICPGQTASLQLAVSGATPQSYSWRNYSQQPEVIINTTVGALDGLLPGNWAVTVTNENGCQAFTTFVIRSAATKLSGTVISNCNEGNSIILTPSPASDGPFTYVWTYLGVTIGTNKDLTGFWTAGNYCVTVTNAASCTSTKCFTVGSPSDAILFIDNHVADDDCGGSCIGSIDLIVKPSPPSTYQWSNGMNTQDINNICAGTYHVTITSSQCVEDYTFIVENGLNSCDLIDTEASPTPNLTSKLYSAPFLHLEAIQVICWNNSCNWPWEEPCSELRVKTIIPANNCWTGMVSILVKEDNFVVKTYIFEVVENNIGLYEINWITSNNPWKPPHPGTYDVEIMYENPGGTCISSTTIDWYGPGNHNDAIGFRDNFWFDWNPYYSFVPPSFRDSYFGAWRCRVCKPANYYIMGDNEDECESQDNWDFIFFNFKPSSFDGNPCLNGGQMEIMGFDAIGQAHVIHDAPITAPAIDWLQPMQPFSNFGQPDVFCSKSGWCLFEPEDVYGPIAGAMIDKKILATWKDDTTCSTVIWDEPGVPNPSPCTAEDEDSCPSPLECDPISGNCYLPCVDDGDCINGGECNEDGFCVEPNGCPENFCPEGYYCQNGECYIQDFCNYSVEVSGQGGQNTYKFYNSTTPSGTLWLDYETYNIPDNITVSGVAVIETTTGCIATMNPPPNPPANPLPITITGYGEFEVNVTTCGSTSSKFHFSITCPDEFQNDVPTEKLLIGKYDSKSNGLSIQPNPFTSQVKVILDEVETSFNGQIILLDNLGRVIVDEEKLIEDGYNSFELNNLETLMKGLYVVLVKKDGQVFDFQKAIKL